MKGFIFLREGCATNWDQCINKPYAITVVDFDKRDHSSTWNYCLDVRTLTEKGFRCIECGNETGPRHICPPEWTT